MSSIRGSLLKTPKVMQSRARMRIGRTIGRRAFLDLAGTRLVRGLPKKTEWPALRKEAKVKIAPTQAAMAKMM